MFLDFFCPIRAYKKYQKSTLKLSFAAQKPNFRTKDGKAYTGKMFNKELKTLLGWVREAIKNLKSQRWDTASLFGPWNT